MENSKDVLRFNGVGCLRQRLALSIISQKPIFINNIRKGLSPAGITDYESNLLGLLDKLMNGSVIQINENGSSVYFKPGTLIGGKVTHTCNNARDIGYYLECIVWLVPMMKKALELTLQGITNGFEDPSVDKLRYTVLPLLKRFGVDDEVVFDVVKRAAAPSGGGIVKFKCPLVKQLKPINFTDVGFVKRVRGTAVSMRVSPAMSSRLIEEAKSILSNYIHDVFITQDHCKNMNTTSSPGFSIALVAETTTGVAITSEASSQPKSNNSSSDTNGSGNTNIVTPEEVAKDASYQLLDNIFYQTCIDVSQQHLMLLYMALCPAHVSKIVIYQPNTYTVQFLKHIELFLGVVFKIELIRNNAQTLNDDVEDSVVDDGKQRATPLKSEDRDAYEKNRFYFSCVGSGITNYNRAIC